MNTDRILREHLIAGESSEDTARLKSMAKEARAFVASFRWAHPIDELFLGYGVGGILAVFLVKFIEKVNGRDEFLWIIVGDLPSAYLVTDNAPTPTDALDRYCELMEDWANAVKTKKDISECFPVRAEPTAENADLLERRIGFVRKEIIPVVRELHAER